MGIGPNKKFNDKSRVMRLARDEQEEGIDPINIFNDKFRINGDKSCLGESRIILVKDPFILLPNKYGQNALF